MKKHIFLSIFLFAFAAFTFAQNAQTADGAYSRPLKDVLQDIEKRFDIQIKYDAKLIDGKTLKYADWRIKPWDAEESLRAVLAPFDYSFAMDNGKYKIKEFEYPRTVAAEGKKFLDYYETLYSNKTEWEKRKAEILACLPEALRIANVPSRPVSPVILTKPRKYDG
ncbi:MAG: hypothetical protein LBN23_05385, partial [Paludibacter sp.]|nr:hypothetical protein [Paludibacter sp.]